MEGKPEHPGTALSGQSALEMCQRSIEATAALTQRNMEILLAVAQVTKQGVEVIVSEMADFSKQSLERASSAVQAMSVITAPSDLARLQTDFARAHFDASRAQLMKLSDSMFRTAREQLAAQAALAQRESGPRAPTNPT